MPKKRTVNNSAHSPTQRFLTDNNAKSKTPDKTKDKTHHTTHKHEQKQEVGSIHVHFSTNTESHKAYSKTQMLTQLSGAETP
jgi:hypothetical protein